MIDSMEYETRESLEEAMRYENNVAFLKSLSRRYFWLEFRMQKIKMEMERIEKMRKEIQKKVDEWLSKNQDKTVIDRDIYEGSNFKYGS